MITNKKLNTILAVLLCSVMLVGIAPTAAFADGTEVAWIGETGYATLEEAVNAAESGATITLGEGVYTLYEKGADTKNKDLTFVGAGADKTTWLVGPTVPNPEKYGTEYNSDYSFDVRDTEAKETVTFKNMTLQAGRVDYLGFAGTDNTVVENCAIEGKTFYWGYTSAIFKSTTFNCPQGDYALWTYSSPEMTFEDCTFNSSGKTINVYTDYGAGKNDIIVNFKNCTVNNTAASNKSVLNINDSNMGNYKYYINIAGVNTITNPDAESEEDRVDIFRDPVTCSRWFGFGGKAATNNTERSVVTIDDEPVFVGGEMVSHEIDTKNDMYTEGYKDDAYTVTVGDWDKADDGIYVRLIEKVCDYCGYAIEYEEEGFAVVYTDGVEGEELFKDQISIVPVGDPTPAFEGGTPSRDGYIFKGWSIDIAETVTENATYTAVWTPKTTPIPKTGDNSNLGMWIILMSVSVFVLVETLVYGKRRKVR